jgi:hypothetical protein
MKNQENMWKTSIKISLIIVMNAVIFLFSSCNNESTKKVKAQLNVEKDIPTKVQKEKNASICFGTWRIDSVAENEIVIDRQGNEQKFQLFNFRKSGVFSMMEITPNVKKDKVLGHWKTIGNSILIENGDKFMKYRFEFSNPNVLILHGEYQISSNNTAKPTFFLTKYQVKRY